MITLNFSVDDQLLTRTDENTVAANSHLVHVCEFAFSSEWDGRGKVATFKKRNSRISVILDNDACVIPPEILQSENKIDIFELSVCGADGNSTITSTIARVPILAGTWDPFTEEITPTLFEQIMDKIDEIEKGEISPELVYEAVSEYMEAHPLEPIVAEDVAAYFEEHAEELKGPKGDTGATGATGPQGPKGDTGVTPTISAAATVDNTTGTPAVNVTKSGTDAAPEFTFAFSGLKGPKGDPGPSGYDDTEIKAEIADVNADIQKIADTFGTMAYEPLDLTLTLGKYARKDNGALVSDQSMVMGYVELAVEPEQIYYITTNLSGNCAIVFYNNGVYVSDLNSLGAISDYQITIPNNVNLMRISNRYASTTDTIVKGYVVSYAPFKAQVDDAFYDIETLQIQVNTLNDVIEHVKYPVYTDKIGELTADYIINYQTGNQTSASGAANTIIDVTPRETYRINCDLSGNTGIVGYDSNNVVTFGFNNVTGADYAISTGVYEVTIPNGTVKLGVSTRHQSSAPIGIYLKTYEFYDFADITETVDNLNFDAKVLAERAYDIETRLRFAWKPFDKGKVVFMTDDTLSDIGVITSLLMNTYNFPMSYACITNTLENVVDANDNNYAKVKDVLVASQAYGGEVFSHSINSDDWGDNPATNGGYNGYIPDSESDRRLRDSKYTLSQYGLEANGFISPRGSDLRNYGYGVSKYYRYAYYQGTDIPQIFHFTRTNIKSLTFENLKAAIDNCASNHSLLVLMCHNVVDTNGEGYGVYPNGFTMADFTAIMDYLKWGTDETKTTPRTDLEVTSLKKVYAEYASIG